MTLTKSEVEEWRRGGYAACNGVDEGFLAVTAPHFFILAAGVGAMEYLFGIIFRAVFSHLMVHTPAVQQIA